MDMSDRTVSFIDAVNAASPSGSKGPAQARHIEVLSESSSQAQARSSSGFSSHIDGEASADQPDLPEEKSRPRRGTKTPTTAAGLSNAPPSTPSKQNRFAQATAPPSIRQHIDDARTRPAVREESPTSLLDPKADQVHSRAHASNIRLTSEARQIIARSASKYPFITAALLQQCGAADLQKPNLADFAQPAIIEAARAVLNQEGILAALLASAVAESTSHGRSGQLAVEALSVTFDQLGKDLIDLGHVYCDLSTLDMSLGVYPIGQLALAIYVQHHSPSHGGGPDVEGAAMAVTFTHDGVFNPQEALKQWNNVYHEALAIKHQYNVAVVVAHLTRAMNASRTEQLRLRPEDAARASVPVLWSEFVYATVDEAGHRRAQHGSSVVYTAAELALLRHDIMAFGRAWIRMDRQDAATASFLLTGGNSAAQIKHFHTLQSAADAPSTEDARYATLAQKTQACYNAIAMLQSTHAELRAEQASSAIVLAALQATVGSLSTIKTLAATLDPSDTIAKTAPAPDKPKPDLPKPRPNRKLDRSKPDLPKP